MHTIGCNVEPGDRHRELTMRRRLSLLLLTPLLFCGPPAAFGAADGLDDEGLLLGRLEIDHGGAPEVTPESAGIIDDSWSSLPVCRSA